jgi:DNA repair protein RecN (Recombination protein N)
MTSLWLRRKIATPDGRRTAWVNDRRASDQRLLRALGSVLVELHGQQDAHGLLDLRTHRRVLDAFAGNAGPKGAMRCGRRGRPLPRRGRRWPMRCRRAKRHSATRRYLRHAVDELTGARPATGRGCDQLDTSRRRMQGAARIRRRRRPGACRAGRATGPCGRAADALRWLESACKQCGGLACSMIRARRRWAGRSTELGEAEAAVEAAIGALDIDARIWSEPRSGCSRSGRWRASIRRRPTSCTGSAAEIVGAAWPRSTTAR